MSGAVKTDKRYRTNCIVSESARCVFIRVGPGNLWVRTSMSVLVDCPMCKAQAQSLCIGRDGFPKSSTHWPRKMKRGQS